MIDKVTGHINKLTGSKMLLIIIFTLALFVRVWNLEMYPEAIDEDEMALGYYAYSLLTNGSDEYGNKYPIYFESAGDYKYGLYSYFATIPVGILGLNTFSTRLTAALAGAISVIAIYYLAMEIFNRKEYALFASFILSLSPVHIHFSRVAYNNILGGLFAILSILFLLRHLNSFRNKELIYAVTFLVLSVFSYQAYRVYLPVVFILVAIVKSSQANGKNWKKIVFSAVLSIVVVAVSFIPPESRARSQDFSLLINKPKLIEQYTQDNLAGVPLVLTRAYHNKIVSITLGTAERYLAYFDPRFLFVRTSESASRHSIPDVGLMHFIEAPLLVVGLLFLFIKIKGINKFIPLSMLAASPLAASLVVEARSPTRAVVIVFAYTLIAALGIYMLSKMKFGKHVLMGLACLYAINFSYVSHQYLVHKIYHHPWHSDVGLKEMVFEVNERKDNYQYIVMSNGHYIPYLFYNNVHPLEFIENSDFAERAATRGVRVERFGKIVFNMPYECPAAGKEDVLYVCFGYQVPKNARLVEVIRFRDGQPAILLVDFGQDNKPSLPERVEYSQAEDERFEDGVIPRDYDSFWPKNI